MSELQEYLKREFSLSKIDEVQHICGIYIFKVEKDGQSYYLKHFDEPLGFVEIQCYELLSDTDLPIVEFYQHTEKSILLRDMDDSFPYRLGVEEDLINENSVRSIARWFKTLHDLNLSKGKKADFLSQYTLAIEEYKITTCLNHYKNNNFFKKLFKNKAEINTYISKCPKVIIHNAFYSKNLFVDVNTRDVVIFDFKFMCKGLRSEELRFIREELGRKSSKSESILLEEYGEFDILEYDIYTLYCHLDCLSEAAEFEHSSDSVSRSIKLLDDGVLENILDSVISRL